MSNRDYIQNLRKEINTLLTNKLFPLRSEFKSMLKNEAIRLCPFKIDDVITLDNGKKGIIKDIDYYSLDYEFNENKFIPSYSDYDVLPEYLFDYSLDNNNFSITWEISGLRLKKNGKVGKISFVGISPMDYIIDKENKTVKSKGLRNYMDDREIAYFDELSSEEKNDKINRLE